MKEMSLQDIQAVSLNILKDVHKFCESHHIRYSLAYGTLIGAIRHKGFIPWDDDIDIIIPRPDFERFCRDYQSAKGFVLYSPEDSKSFLTYARVCDNEHTLVKTNCPWAKEPTGVWIDIFPFEGLPSDESEFLGLVKKIRSIQSKIVGLRSGRYLKLSETTSVRNLVVCLIKRVLYFKENIYKLIRQHIRLITESSYEDADFCGQLCVMDYPEKEHNPKTEFGNYIKVPFCDSEFYVMSGYDSVLKRYYGNYMELPPEEKRTHPKYLSFRPYWK